MGSQQFCLRWNNHQSNMLSMFGKSLDKEAFVDATISCEGYTMKVHKLILSACSPYFETIFAENPCKHPTIIMHNVCHSDLKDILNFMYNGEINVSQDKLPRLLKTAENLNVKGLAEVAQEDQSNVGKFSDMAVGRQTESPQFVPNSVNSMSASISKRKKRHHKNNLDVESCISQPPSKKQDAIFPKITESLRLKPSSPKSCDKSDTIPASADLLSSPSQLINSHNVSPQSPHTAIAQKNQHMPSSNISIPPKETLKIEANSPSPPDQASSDEMIQDSSNSNQEYILEPATIMEQTISNKNETYDKNQNDIQVVNMEMPLDDQIRDPGPSQDSSGVYQDGVHISESPSIMQTSNLGSNPLRSRQLKRNWSDEAMRQALTMITAGGWDIKQTSQTYNIPLRTLYYHLKKFRSDTHTRPLIGLIQAHLQIT